MLDIDDIEFLKIESRRLIDLWDFNLETLESIVKENSQLLEKLIDDVTQKSMKLENEQTRRMITTGIKNKLQPVYNQNNKANPKEEYLHSKDYEYKDAPSNVGYFKEHPEASFLERNYIGIIRGYGKLIEFMIKSYEHFKVENYHNRPDKDILWDIVEKTKDTCSSLGIMITNPKDLKKVLIDPTAYENGNILDDNSIEFNEEEVGTYIEITSFPYFVRIPHFTASGITSERLLINRYKPKILYTDIPSPSIKGRFSKATEEENIVKIDDLTSQSMPHPMLLIEDKSRNTPLLKDYSFSDFTSQNQGYYHYTKAEIIQDLPLDSKEEQSFITTGMTEDEIKASQEKINSVKVKTLRK